MRAYSVDLREHVVAAVQAGRRRMEVAEVFGISLRTVERYLRQQQQTGALAPKPVPGRRREIPPEQEAQLTTQLRAYPTATLEQHRARWAESTGVWISATTMYRAIKRLGWTWKKKRWWPPNGTRTPEPPGGRP
jgi:transposase